MSTETDDIDTICFQYDASTGQSWQETYANESIVAINNDSGRMRTDRRRMRAGVLVARYDALRDTVDNNDLAQKTIRAGLIEEEIKLTKIRFGSVAYPLRQKCRGYFKSGFFSVPEFNQANLWGNGDTLSEARDDFFLNVHQLFQRLYSLCPGEMSDTESEQWKVLRRGIDVNKYEEMTPIQFRKIAEIQSTSPFTVRWWGDEKPTFLDLRTAPPKLAALKAGDRFEAIVEFNRKTRKIGKILTIEYLPQRELPDAPPLNGLDGLKKVSLEEIWGDE